MTFGMALPVGALFGVDFDACFELFDHKLTELRSLLETGRVDEGILSPKASRSRTDIALARWRGSMIERAAGDHSGWIASGFHADDRELADGLARFRDCGGERAIVTNVQVADLAAATERAQRLQALGFDEVVLMDPTPSLDRLLAMADTLGLSAER